MDRTAETPPGGKKLFSVTVEMSHGERGWRRRPTSGESDFKEEADGTSRLLLGKTRTRSVEDRPEAKTNRNQINSSTKTSATVERHTETANMDSKDLSEESYGGGGELQVGLMTSETGS